MVKQAVGTTPEGMAKLRLKVQATLHSLLVAKKKKGEGQGLSLVDMQYEEDMRQLMSIVDKLLEDRERIPTTYTIMSKPKGTSRAQHDDDDSDRPWPSQYTHWNKIPQYWRMGWLSKQYPWLTSESITILKNKGGRNKILLEMFEYETGIKETDELPALCHDKEVMALVLDSIARLRGHRLADFRETCVDDDGKVTWRGWGFQVFQV